MHPAGPAWLVAIEASGLAEAMRHWLWLYPIVEIVHITGLAILVGSVAMFDLRVLGVSRHVPIKPLADQLLPWTLGALLLVVPSGLMMFSAHATDFAENNAFRLKLVLLALAALNALVFHRGVFRSVAAWEGRAPAAARMTALASLGLWIGVISCGRLLAYL